MCDHVLSEEALQRYTAIDFAPIKEADTRFFNYAGPRTSIRTKLLSKDVQAPLAVVVKTLRALGGEDYIEELDNELRIWRLLSSDTNICQFLGAAQLDEWPFDHLSMISKYYDHGNSNKVSVPIESGERISSDCMQFLEKNDITDFDRVNLLKDVLKGIVHIHNKSIVHGDLKGANILIENNGEAAKIADFGSSLIECYCYGDTEPQHGTIPWDAPERFAGKKATAQSDIWAFGCVALEILMDTPPYNSISYIGVLNRMAKGDLPATPNEINLDGMVRITVWKLMQGCWSFEPSERPTAVDLLASLEEVPA